MDSELLTVSSDKNITLLSNVTYMLLTCCSNVECGQLQCMSGEFQASTGVSVFILTLRFGTSGVCM